MPPRSPASSSPPRRWSPRSPSPRERPGCRQAAAWAAWAAWTSKPCPPRQMSRPPWETTGGRFLFAGHSCARPARPVAQSGNHQGRADMTARVPMVSLERARELGEAMGMPARRTQSEAFRTVANNPGVARVAFGQLMQLLENNKFDTRLRELMIMRIGWVTGSAYEWTQHWRVATTAGIPPEDVLAVRE